MIIDTHAHYTDPAFEEDREKLLKNLADHGIGMVVNASASLITTEQTIKLTEQYPFIYGMAGVHPSECGELDEAGIQTLKKAAAHPRIVAIGEIGLDYHETSPDRAIQKHWFCRQMELAGEVNLPVAIHSRDAAADTIDCMRTCQAEKLGGIIHCYSYGVDLARQFLDWDFYLGIGGVVTFTNGKKLKEVVAYAPLDRLVLETDCPYLAPVPNRGKRNSSLNLPFVIDAIAQIKGITASQVEEATEMNARKVYRIPMERGNL